MTPLVSRFLWSSLWLAACAPTLDWREIRVDDGTVQALFPCRPERHSRTVALDGSKVEMELSSCTVEGTTYAAGWTAVRDPAAVTRTLEALQSAVTANIRAAPGARVPFALNGMTPNPASMRLSLDGQLPDGSPVREHAVFASKGLRVYQLMVIGAAPPAEAVATFLAGLKVIR